MTREATASVFTLHQDGQGTWRCALVWHPRLDCWLPAGGHVEPGETAADRHTGQRHAHLDHVFAATAVDTVPVREPEHEVRWFTAAGKSSVAAAVRARHGRGLAIVSQDHLRRVLLREHDIPGGANIGLIRLATRHATGHGFHVIVEGIMRTDHYGGMLAALIAGHPGPAFAYYLDADFEETLRRHATKAEALTYGEAEMRAWYRELDLLPGGIEQVIPAASTLEQTVSLIMADAGLGTSPGPPATPGQTSA